MGREIGTSPPFTHPPPPTRSWLVPLVHALLVLPTDLVRGSFHSAADYSPLPSAVRRATPRMVSSGPPAEATGGSAAWRPPARVAPPALSSPPHLWEVAADADVPAAADHPRRWSGARSPRPSRTSREVDGLRRAAVMAATRLGAPAPPPPIAAYPDVAVRMDDVADDVSVEDLYEPPAAWRDDGVYEDKPAARKVSIDEVQEEKAAAALDAKRQKELKKAIKDYMKTSLSRYVRGATYRLASSGARLSFSQST